MGPTGDAPGESATGNGTARSATGDAGSAGLAASAAAGDRDDAPCVDVGVLVAHSPATGPERLRTFTDRLAEDVVAELAAGTGANWRFFLTDPTPLPDVAARRPSDFLDDAADRMVTGPYDLVVVVTDVSLRSRSGRRVAGLPSTVGRVCVVSTRDLLLGPREGPTRSLDSPAVRWNAATLVLHLVGHLLGATHDAGGDGVMAPFVFDPTRRSTPAFDADVERRLERVAHGVPQARTETRARLRRLGFHLRSGVHNADQIADAVLDSRAPLVPLSLPRLATAAVTPTLILVFSAEAWDVGVHLSNATTVAFAVASVVVAALHLLSVQNLAFPRKSHQVLTEHMAVVNVAVFCILLLAAVGLFGLVWAVMLVIEFVVFPPDLMSTWPSLEDPAVGVVDLARTGAFIATLGVLSGALAGGLEERAVLHHLALFRDRP